MACHVDFLQQLLHRGNLVGFLVDFDMGQHQRAVGGEPSPGAAVQKPVSSEPETQTTTAVFGDWTLRCQKSGVGAQARRSCEIDQSATSSRPVDPLANRRRQSDAERSAACDSPCSGQRRLSEQRAPTVRRERQSEHRPDLGALPARRLFCRRELSRTRCSSVGARSRRQPRRRSRTAPARTSLSRSRSADSHKRSTHSPRRSDPPIGLREARHIPRTLNRRLAADRL